MTSLRSDIDLYDLSPPPEDVRDLYLRGLTEAPKTLPCKLLYDERGSGLFEKICETPEYYPTRTEIEIYEDHIEEMARRIGPGAVIVEYGSGEGLKSRMLIDALADPVAYIPVDISREALIASAESLAAAYPTLEVLPVCGDYTQEITLPHPKGRSNRWAVFFPGSTIGNFHQEQAEKFLRHSAKLVGPGGAMLIGADLVKDRAVLEAAYNDAKGVTAAFNLNLLRRANDEIGADFDLNQFEHRAIFNEKANRIEMHLVSRADQTVRINGTLIEFREGEAIHTESSYKYTPESFSDLIERSGWRPEEIWTDRRGWFSVWDVVAA